MNEQSLQVCMLGDFSIRLGDHEIDDGGNRSRKVWLLLAYMIYTRSRSVTNEELASLLWSDEDASVNPLNAMKTMFHRARSFLDKLGDGVGHQLILRQKGGYIWNTEIPLILDTDQFESLCQQGRSASNADMKIDCWLQALDLYHGDFLDKLSSEPWVVPISAYFHQLYLQTVLEILPLLEQRHRPEDAIRTCRQAVKVEPYNEDIYRYLIRLLLAQGRQREAISIYEDMSELLFANFGIMPSDETLSLYREAIRTVNDRAVSPGIIMEQMREAVEGDGALMCDYDFFKVIYHAVARSVFRSGDAVHLALISVTDKDGNELPRRSLDRVMENLQEVICSNLRRGDIAARCSVSQFILLLPQANYENSGMVCRRLVKSFSRQYPHSPAQLQASIHPLEPTM